MRKHFRCGLVAVVGRPNVGKSTLVNQLVQHKVSITSRRPQTTRVRLLGIKTDERAQIVYVDTPGLHISKKNLLNRYMNRAARGSLEGVDCVVIVVTATGWTLADDRVANLLQQPLPVILAINKIDTLKGREQLLPIIEDMSKRMQFAEVVPVSALTGENVDELERSLVQYLPHQPRLFPEDQVTDRNERFMAAELIREQMSRVLRQELPYEAAVGLEHFKHQGERLHIGAVVWVEKRGQKGIVIGHGGERLKQIGTRARQEMERLFGCKVYLELWVKVREGWADSEAMLRDLQYSDE
ncbi:MAG: GTPase Era [Acidiferrobacterales bacterium]